MIDRNEDLQSGRPVRITVLGSTKGMCIAEKHLAARRLDIGVLRHYVPGHGGDVWFVEHQNVAVKEILEFINADPGTANWSDQARQDLASTVYIAAVKQGQVGLWERS
jgi:hypothetical protein